MADLQQIFMDDEYGRGSVLSGSIAVHFLLQILWMT